jgi:iron complex outermembrane receptor protein
MKDATKDSMKDAMKDSTMRAKCYMVVALLVASAPAGLLAQTPPQSAQTPPQNLGGTSLEDLMNLEVTSVSHKEQALSKTAAAIFVINQEDIRNSGATSITDLLRMVPGVDVAQIDANQSVVSIRGFDAVFANKVLVLIDGRSLYVESFSGVFWDQVNVPVEDIERIEVIRGPGGTVWGANAVNGVINIITKSSADTKGLLIRTIGGPKRTDDLVQYGADAGSKGAYRIFARYSNTENSLFPGGARAADGSHTTQLGFRSDWSLTSRDTVSVEGDYFSLGAGGTSRLVLTSPLSIGTFNLPVENVSGDAMAKWTHKLANGSEISLQIYDNAMRRDDVGIEAVGNTFDVDLEHHISLWSRHDIVWGLDYRVFSDSLLPEKSFGLTVTPPTRTDNLYTAFLQDEIRVARSLFLTLGTKFEHNAYTGFESEPGAQFVWKVNDRHSLWTSAARAIRQPDHSTDGIKDNEALADVPAVGTALVTIYGNTNLKAERMSEFEVGYRGQLLSQFSLDVTGFLSLYDRLNTYDSQTPFFTMNDGVPLMVLPIQIGNGGRAHNYGAEFFARWDVTRWWVISPGLSMLRMTVSTVTGSQDSYISTIPGTSPHIQPQVRTTIKLRRNLEWTTSLKFVSQLSSVNVPGYLRLDSRLGWAVGESAEISIVGQNLSTGRHVEFIDSSASFLTTEVARSVFARISWHFR